MLKYLQQLQNERDSLTQTATTLADHAADEQRDLTDTERASLASMQERCGEIDGQLTTYAGQLDSTRAYAQLRSRLTSEQEQDTSQLPPARQLENRQAVQKSWGELFTESAEFRNYSGRGSSGEVELPGLLTRAPIMDSTFPGQLPPHFFSPTPWVMTTPLLDALGKEATTSNVVEWYTWPGSYPLAGEVPEGTDKPEAVFEPIPHTDSLKTYAHYRALSRQALADIPRIQSIVENALRGGVLARLEAAAAAALAAAGNGITAVADATLLAAIRVAIGEVQDAGYATPNAVLLNPTDFAQLDLSIMGTTVAGPVRNGSVWNVRAIAVGAIPAGTAYVGDFNTAVTLFSRGTTSVFMTDSHADYFIKNLLVILAETRALVGVTEPAAARKCTWTGVTVAAPAA